MSAAHFLSAGADVVVLEQAYMSILQLAAAFLVILIVLMFRPSGLFGTRTIERV